MFLCVFVPYIFLQGTLTFGAVSMTKPSLLEIGIFGWSFKWCMLEELMTSSIRGEGVSCPWCVWDAALEGPRPGWLGVSRSPGSLVSPSPGHGRPWSTPTTLLHLSRQRSRLIPLALSAAVTGCSWRMSSSGASPQEGCRGPGRCTSVWTPCPCLPPPLPPLGCGVWLKPPPPLSLITPTQHTITQSDPCNLESNLGQGLALFLFSDGFVRL